MIKHFIKNEPLKKHTTFKVGGPAQYFYEAKTIDDLVKTIVYARTQAIPFLILGAGSNILISDQGITGLIIKNQTQQIKVLSHGQVEIDSGVRLPLAIFSLLNQNLVGLEHFVGIPGTVGGATYMNIHGGDKFWADYLVSVKILDQDNQIRVVGQDYFNFKYDYSSLHDNHHIVLSEVLQLKDQSSQNTKLKVLEKLKVKSHHPQKSAGCIFQNLNSIQQKRLNLPTASIGYLMDKVLKIKGTKIGQAIISPKHAGFIENLGEAKAKDIIKLIDFMKTKAKEKLDLDLKLEIQILGF